MRRDNPTRCGWQPGWQRRSSIAADLDKLAVYVTALDTDARLKVFDDHVDAIKDASRKLQRMIKPLRAAQKIRTQENKG